jgi:hypothetical protein
MLKYGVMKVTPYLFKKIMTRYLAIFSDIHGDEFEVKGFRLMTDKEVSNFEDIAASITWEFAFYATSESLNYSNGEELLSRIEYKEIDKEQYTILDKIFGGEFGTFIGPEYLQTIFNGESEIDEEEFDEND